MKIWKTRKKKLRKKCKISKKKLKKSWAVEEETKAS